MLYVITQPFGLSAGTYSCMSISPTKAAELIKEANSKTQLRSFIHFESTAFVLNKLTGIEIELVKRTDPPQPSDGDCLIDIRVKKDTPKGRRIAVDDLEFLLIHFKQLGYENTSDSTGWPMVMR